MTTAQEMFRFVSVRRPRRAAMRRITSRLIRDRRPVTSTSLLVTLFGPGGYGPGEFGPRLRAADDFVAGPLFVDARDPEMLALEPAVDFFREHLAPGVAIADLAADFERELPVLATLLQRVPPEQLLHATERFLGRIWDSFYSLTLIGCDRFISTDYLVDALRVFQVLRLLWLSVLLGLQRWAGGAFADYDTLIDTQRAAAAAGRSAIAAAGAGRDSGSFRVPLETGAVPPPSVGDLLIVEQELRGYEFGELAESQSIMRGERRERTTRNLARTSTTTTTETTSEVEESTTTKTDERFSLSSQAQQTATESFGVQAGVSVSGKFGPVQVGATVNASFDTSSTSSQSTAQEYAKTVTEEATKRVKNSIKQTSSVTILTETQDTLLRGFNNEQGAGHVNGLYRWLNKRYTARLMNYGRRLMVALSVPEPSRYYHAMLARPQTAAIGALEEPLHPSRISRNSLEPLPDDTTDGGFLSPEHVTEGNYAELAAIYDVAGIAAPPPEYLTGSKAIVYPEAMQAKEIEEHDAKNELGWVSADNTLAVDPDYQITKLGVFASTGGNGRHGSWADALKLGFDNDEADLVLVQVGAQSFYFSAVGDEDRTINTNFNEMVPIHGGSAPFGDVVSPALPITVTARFEGAVTFTVIYTGRRRDEAYAAWQSQAYAQILEGYAAKKQAYDQSLALAQAQGQAAVETQTYQLREDQYRAIELTELKRGFVDLLSAGTAAGHTSIDVATDGTPTIVHDEADAGGLTDWRSPLANGTVAEHFERCYEWENATYEFRPYYWAGAQRWPELAVAAGADPIFEQFLRAGSASVVVPVRPGYERPVLLFLKTSMIWSGGSYLSLFNNPEMLDMYADVEQGLQLDPPEQVGEDWEIVVPTSMVMLQEDDTLPDFPPADQPPTEPPADDEPAPDDTVPF
jgi:hypothetical protein